MQSIFSSIARLLGRKSITQDEILEVLRSHETRIQQLEGQVESLSGEVSNLHKTMDVQTAAFDGKLKDLAKKGQAAKKQSTDELKKLKSDLDALIEALDLVVAGEFAPARRKEISSLIRVARGHRTRVSKVLEQRVN